MPTVFSRLQVGAEAEEVTGSCKRCRLLLSSSVSVCKSSPAGRSHVKEGLVRGDEVGISPAGDTKGKNTASCRVIAPAAVARAIAQSRSRAVAFVYGAILPSTHQFFLLCRKTGSVMLLLSILVPGMKHAV